MSMARIKLIQKAAKTTLFSIIVFLTWFIRLITFFGDVTIWFTKNILKGVWSVLKKFKLDRLGILFGIGPRLKQFIRHPIIAHDRNFKVGLLTIIALILAVWFFTKDLPSPKQLETQQLPQTTKIYDRNGQLLYNVYTNQNRTLIPLSEVPQSLKQATIAIEDKDFYKHRGFDVYGIARAARKTVFEGSLQGG